MGPPPEHFECSGDVLSERTSRSGAGRWPSRQHCADLPLTRLTRPFSRSGWPLEESPRGHCVVHNGESHHQAGVVLSPLGIAFPPAFVRGACDGRMCLLVPEGRALLRLPVGSSGPLPSHSVGSTVRRLGPSPSPALEEQPLARWANRDWDRGRAHPLASLLTRWGNQRTRTKRGMRRLA